MDTEWIFPLNGKVLVYIFRCKVTYLQSYSVKEFVSMGGIIKDEDYCTAQ